MSSLPFSKQPDVYTPASPPLSPSRSPSPLAEGSGCRGKLFENEIKSSLKRLAGVWWLRLPDYRDMYFSGAVSYKWKSMPADFIAFYSGKLSLIECKSCTGTSFPLSRLSDSQMKGLSDATGVNILGFILFRIQQSRADPPRVISIPIADYKALSQKVSADGKKSFTWSELSQFGTEVFRCHPTFRSWDLRNCLLHRFKKAGRLDSMVYDVPVDRSSPHGLSSTAP